VCVCVLFISQNSFGRRFFNGNGLHVSTCPLSVVCYLKTKTLAKRSRKPAKTLMPFDHDLRLFEIACNALHQIHFDRARICTQVNTSFPPFGYRTLVSVFGQTSHSHTYTVTTETFRNEAFQKWGFF